MNASIRQYGWNFKIRQNNVQILTSQPIIKWHYENDLNFLRTLLKGYTSNHVYIGVGGDIAFISLPRFSKIIHIKYVSISSHKYANYQIHKVICIK